VFQSDDVVQFRRRRLEHIAILDRRHAMDGLRQDMYGLARVHFELLQLTVDLDLVQKFAGMEIDRLFLPVVILQAQRMACVDVKDLADISLRLRPMKLVPPGLLHSRDDVVHSYPSLLTTFFAISVPKYFSISSTVPKVSTRAATRTICRTLVSLITRRAMGIAPGVMLNSRSPQPINSFRSSGSDAISPQTETGMPSRAAARRT